MRVDNTTIHASYACGPWQEDVAIQLRIRAEFKEMPGLKLTLPQASRLFNVDAARCERVLETLVARGLLSVRGRTFVRTPSA
jgi:hypothetical protein